MRKVFNSLWAFIPISLLLFPRLNISCADVVSPEGGPKDTIPPQIVSTYPKYGTLSFKGRKISITFNKPIETNDIYNQLIISPGLKKTEGKRNWVERIKNKSIELKLLTPLEENTTYTFYFRESIRDITEKNIANNPKIVFSTGNYIDSLSIKGVVYELMNQKLVKNGLVALYKVEEGRVKNILNNDPDYFTKTDKEGNFEIENIKSGTYKVCASGLSSKNNLIIDPGMTQYGFLKEDINLTQSIEDLAIPILKLDVNEFSIKNKRPQGKYFEIIFNKEVIDYELTLLQKPKRFTEMPPLYSNLLKDKKVIRVYNTLKLLEEDTITAKLFAKDIIGNIIEDTVLLNFKESNRKKEELESTFIPELFSNINAEYPRLKGQIFFNKPIKSIQADSIVLKLGDGVENIPILESDFTFSEKKDCLFLNKELNKQVIESLQYTKQIKEEKLSPFTFYAEKGSFISLDKDSSQIIQHPYNLKTKNELGIIGGKVETNAPGFIVQLLDNKRFKVLKEVKNKPEYRFIDLEPGTYKLRLLILEEKESDWNPGNIKKNQIPSPVVFYPEEVRVRSNWESTYYDFKYFR